MSLLTRAGIAAVVGRQAPMADTTAIRFSQCLCRVLAVGQSIDAAVTDGRLAIRNISGGDRVLCAGVEQAPRHDSSAA